MAKKKEKKTSKSWKKFLKIGLGIVLVYALISALLPFSPVKCVTNRFYSSVAKGVDLCTMEVFEDASAWKPGTYKDKNHVYFKNMIIEGADPETFEHLGDHYGKDKNGVFFRGETIDGADPNTFKKLERWYSLDSEHVYSHTSIVEGADPYTFKKLSAGYATDGEFIYFSNQKIENVDNNSFLVVDGGFAVDKSNLYYHGEIVPELSPQLFEYIGREYGKMFIKNIDGEFIVVHSDGGFQIASR